MTKYNKIISILSLSNAGQNSQEIDRKHSLVNSSNLCIALIPVLLVCLFYTYKAVDFPVHDFANYYFGATFLADGNFTSDIYFPYYFNKAISDMGYSQIFVSFAPNSPFLAALFYPFSLLSPESAKLFFNILSCLLLIFSLYRLTVFYKIRSIYMLLIPIVFFVPIKNSLLFGQVYFLLFFLLAESLLAYENKRLIKMAAFLSVAIMLKVFPAIFLLMLCFRKQFHAAFYVGIFCGLLLLLSTALTGIDVWLFYITKVLPRAANGEIAGPFVDNYQSVLMFLKRLFVFDETLNPNSIFNYPLLVSAFVAVLKILLIAAGWFLTRKNNNLTVFSFWIFTAIVLSPYGSTYTFVLLVIPFFAMAKSRLPVMTQAALIGLLFLVSNFPLTILSRLQFPFSYGRLAFLLVLMFVFIAFVMTPIRWKIVSSLAVAAFVIALISLETPEIQQRHFVKNAPILIYDYTLSKNTLTYTYWNENGDNQKSIAFKYSKAAPLQLQDNQIYNGDTKLTSDNSNKLKPMLLNDDSILLLSDSERGIGFYTLKIIDLNKVRKP